MTMESKRAVIYARYSSSRQREESIERQIEIAMTMLSHIICS